MSKKPKLFRPYPPRKGTWVRAIKPGSTYDGMVWQWMGNQERSAFNAAEIRRATKAEIEEAKAMPVITRTKKNEKRARPFKVNALDNVSDSVPIATLTEMTFLQDKKPAVPLKPPTNPIGLKLRVPPIQVKVVMKSTEQEGGMDGGHFGDVLLNGQVNNGNRYTIATKLRELADQISNTVGDPMVSANITVLMSRPRK